MRGQETSEAHFWLSKSACCVALRVSRTGTSGEGQFDFPHFLATDGAGSVFVTDWGNNRVHKFAADGTKPEATEGKNFFDTGVALITAKPVEGVESISVAEGLDLCWG